MEEKKISMKKFLVGLSAVAVLGLGALASCGGGG